MTNEEIDKMQGGSELDALVAKKVMGWKIHPRNTAHWMRDGDDEMDYVRMGHVSEWKPSVNIAAAWQVVEKLKTLPERGFKRLGIERHNPEFVLVSDFPGEWYVNFDGQGTVRAIHAKGNTAPLAICHAALKAMMGEKAA